MFTTLSDPLEPYERDLGSSREVSQAKCREAFRFPDELDLTQHLSQTMKKLRNNVFLKYLTPDCLSSSVGSATLEGALRDLLLRQRPWQLKY